MNSSAPDIPPAVLHIVPAFPVASGLYLQEVAWKVSHEHTGRAAGSRTKLQ